MKNYSTILKFVTKVMGALFSLVIAVECKSVIAQTADLHTPAGVQIIAKSQKYVFTVDEPVLIDLTITNNGSKPFSYDDLGLPLKEFDIVVKDSHGALVPLTQFGRQVKSEVLPSAIYGRSLRVVESGDGYEYHFWLNHQYDMTLDGTYYVTIRRTITVNNKPFEAVSNSAMIKVTEPVNVFNNPSKNLEVPTYLHKPEQN